MLSNGVWLAHLEGVAEILLSEANWMEFPLPSLLKL